MALHAEAGTQSLHLWLILRMETILAGMETILAGMESFVLCWP